MKDYTFHSGIGSISFDEFSWFVNQVNADFTPPLLDRIPLSLQAYFSKLNEKAEVVVCKCDNKVVGALYFYCNNYDTHIAYITLVAVINEHRNKGIASALLTQALEICADKKMHKIGIHTNNELAKNCYLKNGFSIIEETTSNNSIRYYLEKQIL